MKWILSTALLSFALLATEDFTKKECFSIANKIDRKYCQDKKIEAIKKQFSGELAWYKKNGVTAKSKEMRLLNLEAELERNSEQKMAIDNESAALLELQTVLKAAKVDKKAKDFKVAKATSAPVKKVEQKKVEKKVASKKVVKKKEDKKDPGLQGQLQDALQALQKKK